MKITFNLVKDPTRVEVEKELPVYYKLPDEFGKPIFRVSATPSGEKVQSRIAMAGRWHHISQYTGFYGIPTEAILTTRQEWIDRFDQAMESLESELMEIEREEISEMIASDNIEFAIQQQ